MRESPRIFEIFAFSERRVRVSPPCDTPSLAATDPEFFETSNFHTWRALTQEDILIVAIIGTGMLYNIPDDRQRSKEYKGSAEAEAHTIGISSPRCRAFATRQPGRALQEMRTDGMSLRRRHRPRPGLLSFRNARPREDTIVLRSAAAQEPSVSIPAKPSQAAGTHQRNHRAQSGASGARSARRRLIQNREGALLFWISGVTRRLARWTPARQLRDSVACWPRCCWTR